MEVKNILPSTLTGPTSKVRDIMSILCCHSTNQKTLRLHKLQLIHFRIKQKAFFQQNGRIVLIITIGSMRVYTSVVSCTSWQGPILLLPSEQMKIWAFNGMFGMEQQAILQLHWLICIKGQKPYFHLTAVPTMA
jgi:hypothetical protein